MSEQKNDWHQVKIGDLLTEYSERSSFNNQHEVLSVTKEGICSQQEYFKKQIASEDNSGYKVVRKGDVVFSAMNLWMGSIDVVKDQEIGIVSPAYITMRPTERLVDTDFLGYFLRGGEMRSKYVKHSQQGASIVRRNLNKDDLLGDEVCIPPLPEQKKIAEILYGIDGEIAVLLKKKGKLEKTLTAYLSDAIPSDGEFMELQELCKVTDGAHKTPTYAISGVPFLRVTDIKAGNLDPSSFKYIPEEEHLELIKRCRPERGDILFSKNGTIGVPRLIDWDWDFSIFVSLALLKIKDRKQLFPEFCELLLKSPLLVSQIFATSKQGTVTNLHLEEIRKFKVYLPSREGQQKIISEYQALCKLISACSCLIEKKKFLKTAIISNLLSGRRRVSV